MTLHSTGEPARTVLLRALSELGTGRTMSYRLLYDPVVRYYMINFQGVGGRMNSVIPAPSPSSVASFSFTTTLAPPVEKKTDNSDSGWFQKAPVKK